MHFLINLRRYLEYPKTRMCVKTDACLIVYRQKQTQDAATVCLLVKYTTDAAVYIFNGLAKAAVMVLPREVAFFLSPKMLFQICTKIFINT